MGFEKIDKIKYLRTAPILSNCSVQNLSRLIPYVSEHHFENNETIFQTGSVSDKLYLIIEGTIQLLSGLRIVDEISQGFFGEEAAIGRENYILNAIAKSSTVVLTIDREALNKIFEKDTEIIQEFFQSFINHYLEDKTLKHKVIRKSEKNILNTPLKTTIGWTLAVLLPICVLLLPYLFNWEIVESIRLFLTVFSAALVLWTFNLVSEFIPAIIIIFSLLVLSIAPPSVVLSGFSSSSFFLALSIFALGAVLTTSGLTYRLVLNILKVVPQTQFSYGLTLFLIGLFLTPVLPSANGRTQLVTPLLIDMIDALKLHKGGKGATRLAFATFTGSTFMSFLFLSSKPIQFVLVGFLPSQVRERFSLPYWTLAAAVAGAVVIAGYLIISTLLFRNQEVTELSRQTLEIQLGMLGPMSDAEWTALGSILIFLVGVLTSSLHGIAIPWVALLILCFLLSGKVIAKKQFRNSIDWPFLILLGSLIGLSKSIAYIGFDDWISSYLGWLGEYMRTSFSLFVLLFSITIFLARLLLPMALIVPLFATIFIPLAEMNGINPWLIAFIILIISDGWFLPYQYSPKLLFMSITNNQDLINTKSLNTANILMNIVRVFAIYASFYYWEWLGIK
ncbi:MAG: anion permease [Crocosphaera sp.]|nr:anion permease [Crocosphaera sp.]